jgi:hypothetical protein
MKCHNKVAIRFHLGIQRFSLIELGCNAGCCASNSSLRGKEFKSTCRIEIGIGFKYASHGIRLGLDKL